MGYSAEEKHHKVDEKTRRSPRETREMAPSVGEMLSLLASTNGWLVPRLGFFRAPSATTRGREEEEEVEEEGGV